jgi:glycopeptidolipid biosynthesis protein
LQQFETALRALPERQRQQSVLEVFSLLLQHPDRLKPAEPARGALASTDRFRAAVQSAKVGPDNDIPHVSASVIAKYGTDLQLLGLL